MAPARHDEQTTIADAAGVHFNSSPLPPATPVSQSSGGVVEPAPREPSVDRDTLPFSHGGAPGAARQGLRRGEEVDRYVVLDELGRGGMGAVYLAWDTQLARRVAIKVLVAPSASAHATHRLQREAQAMARLRHPNVVAIYDVGLHRDAIFLAMEYVDGASLHPWLAERRSWRAILDTLLAAGEGLAATHAVGLVHRDFKPGNVLVARDGRVMVTDFGIARAENVTEESTPPLPPPTSRSEPTPHAGASLDDRITIAGTILGTPGYLAPEQALDQKDDARSDQFSFCVTAYRALYGAPPFANEDMLAYVDSLRQGSRPPPPGSGVPRWIYPILARGMSYRPDQRFPSMRALLDALGRDPRRARRRWAAAAVAAALMLSGAAVYAKHEHALQVSCEQEGRLVDAAWNDAARARVRERIAGSGSRRGAEVAARVVASLDHYAEGWAEARRVTCVDTRVRRSRDEATFAARDECLEEGRAQLASMIDLLGRTDARTADLALRASYMLPRPAACLSPSPARAAAAAGSAHAGFADVRRLLAEAATLRATGQVREAVATTERAFALARDSHDERGRVEALYRLAMLRTRTGDAVASVGDAMDAYAAADARGDDVLAGRAAAHAAAVLGERLDRKKDGERWLALARAKVARVGHDDLLEAEVLSAEAQITAPDDSLRIYEALRPIQARIWGPASDQVALVLNNHAIALNDVGQPERALALHRESIAILEDLYGKDDPELAVDYQNLSVVLFALGRYDEAEAASKRSYELRDFMGPDNVRLAWPISVQSGIAARRGQYERALEIAHQALRIADANAANAANAQVLLPSVLIHEGEALLALGRAPEARAPCERALTMLEKDEPLDPAMATDEPLTCLGRVELAVGHVDEAVRLLSRAESLRKREEPAALAFTRFALAQALHAAGRDPERAAGLARQARADLARLPTLAAATADVDHWLAATP